jgi:hypothetical protein
MAAAAYIAGYVRTQFPFAKKGALAGVRLDDLGVSINDLAVAKALATILTGGRQIRSRR